VFIFISYFNTFKDHDSDIDEKDLAKLENDKMLFGLDLEHQLHIVCITYVVFCLSFVN
jgi:hypothetical protein